MLTLRNSRQKHAFSRLRPLRVRRIKGFPIGGGGPSVLIWARQPIRPRSGCPSNLRGPTIRMSEKGFKFKSETLKTHTPQIRGRELNTNLFFLLNFSGASGISRQNPARISRQKILFPWFRGAHRTFWPRFHPPNFRGRCSKVL